VQNNGVILKNNHNVNPNRPQSPTPLLPPRHPCNGQNMAKVERSGKMKILNQQQK
jgi:hypothetical protein